MPYATPADLIARLGEREARAISRTTSDEPDLVELARLIAEAEDEVNGHIGRRYFLPLTRTDGQLATAPMSVTRVVIDIARYHATGTEIMVTEEIRNRYKDSCKLLEGWASGAVQLGDYMLARSGGPAPTGGSTSVRTGAKLFGDLSGML